VFNRTLQLVSVLGISVILLLTVIGLASKSDIVLASPNAQAATTTPNSQAQTTQRTISVSGMGQVTVKPDQATFTIGVQITDPSLTAATQSASDKMTKVLDALKGQGVDAKDIQTSNYSVNPITDQKQGAAPQVTGYQVSNIVTVTVKNLDKVGQVLDAGMSAGANYLGGISFGVADPAASESEARTAAVKNATAIAQTLAQASGIKLGRVLTISEINVGPRPPVPFAPAAAQASGAGPVETGSLTISTQVQVEFEIAE
jgi:uncharacterized protein YggE